MDQKYGEFVGVDSLHAAVITEDTEANYTAEAPEYLAPAAEIAGEAETNSTPTYYDNKPANNYISEGITTLTLTVSGVPANIAAKYLGKKYNAASGRVYDDGEPNPPDVALSFRYNKGKDGYRYYQYLKGNFTGGAEEAATKTGGGVEIRTYQLTYTAVTTVHGWEIDGEMKSLKRIYADTSDPAFNPTGWFDQVQTPDTTTLPDALALSNIIPDDGAVSIEVDTEIVLTFNNKIATEGVVLVDADGNVIAVTKHFNSARKVLTLTPLTDLAAATKYIVLVSGVIDVYGKILAVTAKDFTTAA